MWLVKFICDRTVRWTCTVYPSSHSLLLFVYGKSGNGSSKTNAQTHENHLMDTRAWGRVERARKKNIADPKPEPDRHIRQYFDIKPMCDILKLIYVLYGAFCLQT